MNKNAPILITGCPRSGTSMIAGIINICGASTGMVNKMYENKYIRETISKPYLKQLGVDENGQYPLPNGNQILIPSNWRVCVEKVMQRQGIQGTWLYKDFRMSLLYPIWMAAFPEAKWVIVRRNDEGIIDSCMKTSYMSAFDNPEIRKKVGIRTSEEGWQWWVDYYDNQFYEMKKAIPRIREVWPEKMVNKEYNEIRDLVLWLGLEWKKEEVVEFIQPKLFKTKTNLL